MTLQKVAPRFSNRGMSMVEVLIASVLVGVLGLAVTQVVRHQISVQRHATLHTTLSDTREKMMAAITSQMSWEHTKSKNNSMACSRSFPMTCVHNREVSISLHDALGRPLFGQSNLVNGGVGLSTTGSNCDYNSETDKSCIFRVNVSWKVLCPPTGPCHYPEELVSIRFEARSGSTVLNLENFNLNNFNRTSFASNQSPVAVCAGKGNYVFAGHGKTLRNGNGVAYVADPEGCVSIAAFTGKTGARGPTGSTGARGGTGARGPDGKVIYGTGGGGGGSSTKETTLSKGGPTPEEEETCNAYPTVCALYKKYFDRYPEQSGAVYWASQIEHGTSMAVIEEEFRLRAEGSEFVMTNEGTGVTFDQHAEWKEIAEKHGLDINTNECTNLSGAACDAANAKAAEEYNGAVTAFCSDPAASCEHHFR